MVKVHLSRTPLGYLPPIFLAPCLLSPPIRSIATSAQGPKSANRTKEKSAGVQGLGGRSETKEMRRGGARTSKEGGTKKEASRTSFRTREQHPSDELINPSSSRPPPSPSPPIHSAYLELPSTTPTRALKPINSYYSSNTSYAAYGTYHPSWAEVGNPRTRGHSVEFNSFPPSSSSFAPSPTLTPHPSYLGPAETTKPPSRRLLPPRPARSLPPPSLRLPASSTFLASPSRPQLSPPFHLPASPLPPPSLPLTTTPARSELPSPAPLPRRQVMPPSPTPRIVLPPLPSFLRRALERVGLLQPDPSTILHSSTLPPPGSPLPSQPMVEPSRAQISTTPQIPPPPSFLKSNSSRDHPPRSSAPHLLDLDAIESLDSWIRSSPSFRRPTPKPVEPPHELDPPPVFLPSSSPLPAPPFVPQRTSSVVEPPQAQMSPPRDISPPSFLKATPSRDDLPQPSPPHLLLSTPSRPSLDINPSIPITPARVVPKRPQKVSGKMVALKESLINLLTSPTPTHSSNASIFNLGLASVLGGKTESSNDDLAWYLYSSLDGERLPPSLLPFLFNSQRVLQLTPEERARRLLRIFRDASQDPPLSVPSSDSVGESSRWWLSLEQLEETFESALRVAETGSDASSSIGISILLREVWSTMMVLGGQGRQSDTRRDGFLWRWVGISLPRPLEDGGNAVAVVAHHPPSSSSTRIIQLTRLLDQVGSPSINSVRELGRSFLGGRTDSELVEEIEIAIEQTEELRRTRDNALHPSKISAEERITRRIISSDPRSFSTPKVVGLGDGKDVESWIHELLPSLNIPPSNASKIDLERAAPSLRHRTTTSILLLSHLERRVTHDTPRQLVAQIVAAIHHLSFLPSHFHVPNSELRLFASTILQAYPTLQVVETEDIYRLLTAFVAVEDLPFASRLYRCFRLRAPEFGPSGHLLQKLIELSIGFRTSSVPEVEDTSLSSHDGILSADVYADYISQGNPPLELGLLLPFVEQMGRRPNFGGVAFRAITESLEYHGEDLLTDELMIVLADSTSRRVIKSICDSVDPTKDLPTEVSATDVLDLLPFFRGFCRPPRTPPPQVFNLAFHLVDSHPTPSNLALLDSTFDEMLHHGPTPTRETVNALISAHLKRGKERASFKAFASREPFDSGRIDMGRVVVLVEVMTTRLGLRPDRETWSLLVEGFLETRRTRTDVALETFMHAHREKQGPYQRATTLLVERLVGEERLEEAWEVVKMHDRARGLAVEGPRFAAVKHAVKQALRARPSAPLIEEVVVDETKMVVEGPSEVEAVVKEEEFEVELVRVMAEQPRREGRSLAFSEV